MEALDGKHDVNGVLLTVDLYQKTRNDLCEGLFSSGFEQRLVAQRQGGGSVLCGPRRRIGVASHPIGPRGR